MTTIKPLYATLDDLEAALSQVRTLDMTPDQKILDPTIGMQFLDAVSRRVDDILSPDHSTFFGPIRQVRKVRLDSFNHSNSNGWLHLPWPIVELYHVTNQSVDYLTKVEIADPQTIQTDGSFAWAGLGRRAVVEIEALWGWPDDTYDAWGEPLDALDATQVVASDALPWEPEELPVTSPGLKHPLTGVYVYAPGAVLKIGQELMVVRLRQILADEDEQSGVQVIRNVLGSTATEHADDATIFRWYPPSSLVSEVARQAAFLYIRRGAFQAEFVDGVGLTTYPPDLLSSLHAVLTEFQR